jgi:hypothetical protein
VTMNHRHKKEVFLGEWRQVRGSVIYRNRDVETEVKVEEAESDC